jgi:hypothetical protein
MKERGERSPLFFFTPAQIVCSVHLGDLLPRLSELRPVFAGNFIHLLSSELFGRHAGRIASFAEKTIKASRRDNPEQEHLVIGIRKSVPGISGNEYRSALVKTVPHIVEDQNTAAFENVERFIHLKVPMDWNACADWELLGSHREIVGACGGANLDKDVAGVAKMNEMFAFGGAEHISVRRRGLSLGRTMGQ